jgi:pilus assembly protein Flp/PilA
LRVRNVTSRMTMAKVISRFCKNESAATAIEYALIAGFVSIVIVGAVQTIGTSLSITFSSVASGLK